MKIKLLVLGSTLCLASSFALAEEEKQHEHSKQKLSYSYLVASSLEYDMDIAGIDVEPDGDKLKLSLSLGDSLFGVIDRQRSDGKFAGLDYDFDTEGYGFGFHGDSWYASYTYNIWDFDNNEFDVDTISLGFRDMWTDRLEFNASYSWNDIENADNEDGFQLGFAYELWEQLHLVADYETIGGHLDIDSVSVGVRFDL